LRVRLSKGHRVLVLAGFGLAAMVPAAPAIGQSDEGAAPGYDFYNLHALADGVTASFNLKGFLPIEDLVGLSSITSESHFGAGRSDSLAALPDPGDLILTLPGTLSALLGISGLPDYPAAASADASSAPVVDVQIAPDVGLGAGRLHAEAADAGSSAFAFVGNQVDTVGLLPSFSIGSIKTTAHTTRVNATTYESVATTTVSDLKLLGGLVRISQITSEVTAGIANDKPTAEVSTLDISGATIAGQAIGITDKGIVVPGSQTALAPIIDSLVTPLVAQGITIKVIPATTVVGARTATATGAALDIEVPLSVEGYPGIFDLTLGKATAELEVGALSDTTTAVGDAGGSLGDTTGSAPIDSSLLPGLGDSSGVGTDLPLGPVASRPAAPTTGTEIVSVPARRVVQDWDLTTLYRVLLLGGIALFAAGQVIVRTTLRPRRRSDDLRQLWRW
jgi:hypothetical protein